MFEKDCPVSDFVDSLFNDFSASCCDSLTAFGVASFFCLRQ